VRLIVVGSPSVDLLHFRGRSERSAGGAGLYTGLAAQRAGADVTVVAPRPEPMPPELEIAAAALDWVGPTVGPSALPHFEIEYMPDGETVYHKAVRGSEGDIRYEDVPDLPPGTLIYVVPLLDPERQLSFAQRLHDRGLRVACGAYKAGVREHREVIDQIIAVSDFFFCNEREAEMLFGSAQDASVGAGSVLFITRGPRGARVVLGDYAVDVPPTAGDELDPTGAGDTFCGTTLARIGMSDHPVIAARWGAAAGAEMISGVGPSILLEPGDAPLPNRDSRVRPNSAQIERIAPVIANAGETTTFDFVGPRFPEVGDATALDFFFAGTLQQFGFWSARDGHYHAPMIAKIDGEALKGSDFLWAAYLRWSDGAPEELGPTAHAELDVATFNHRLRDDAGVNPLPAGDLHPAQAIRYGRDMCALGWTPESVLEVANQSDRPLATFLTLLDRVGGYKEDPWRKKSALLAAILAQRPERFLRFGTDEDLPPIVDYHCQRSCLRLGLVEVVDPALRARLADRAVIEADEEEAVRAACYDAVAEVHRLSGRSMGAVDWFFFQNRTRCPEMTEPDCAACPADPVCAHAKDLFQPVFRTTAY